MDVIGEYDYKLMINTMKWLKKERKVKKGQKSAKKKRVGNPSWNLIVALGMLFSWEMLLGKFESYFLP